MNLLPKIAVTAAAVLLLASCGKSSDSTASGSSSKSSSSSASASDTASSPTAAPAGGTKMTGTGYTYSLPDGWTDISTDLKASQPGIDTGGRAAPATPPFTANLNTLTTPSDFKGVPTSSDLDALAKQIKAEVATLSPDAKTLPHIKIDGSPAVHQEGDATSKDAQGKAVKFFLVQYFVVHSGKNYGLTFAFPTDSTAGARDKIVQPVLASFKFS
jgi:hypothetical protein